VSWRIFEPAAAGYERWYSTRRGRRADAAERRLLLYLLEPFRKARTAVEVGCGTGHFAAFLARHGLSVTGLDRAPAMLIEARRQDPWLRLALGDAHHLPFRDRCVDLTVFVTTLEFLEDPVCALREAVRIARQGVVAIVLNRYSPGGLSRRWGAQSRGALLGEAMDFTLAELRSHLERAADTRADSICGASTLFPGVLLSVISRIPLGDVIGSAVRLKGGG